MPFEGREVVIVEAARTPIGRGHPEKGYYKDTHPNALLGAAYRAVVERARPPPPRSTCSAALRSRPSTSPRRRSRRASTTW
jgi:hypothetical protein